MGVSNDHQRSLVLTHRVHCDRRYIRNFYAVLIKFCAIQMTKVETEVDFIKDWYRYNSYVRKKYLKAVFNEIPKKERYIDRGASFPSVVDIFMHVLDAYRWWFIFVYGDRLSEYERLRGKKYTRKEVEKEEKKIDAYVMDFVLRLREQDLNRTITYRDGSKIKAIELRQMLYHMVEEELQHRGELNALFWQLDIDPPITSYNEWMRARSKNK